ncbi:uncharacterized protein LOC141955047 [Athene noctua]|uniref:uncharacterized protein LOC141955047 n=1 Tax=Athene noctua TaxID=126797 RepID=UPI003EC00147
MRGALKTWGSGVWGRWERGDVGGRWAFRGSLWLCLSPSPASAVGFAGRVQVFSRGGCVLFCWFRPRSCHVILDDTGRTPPAFRQQRLCRRREPLGPSGVLGPVPGAGRRRPAPPSPGGRQPVPGVGGPPPPRPGPPAAGSAPAQRAGRPGLPGAALPARAPPPPAPPPACRHGIRRRLPPRGAALGSEACGGRGCRAPPACSRLEKGEPLRRLRARGCLLTSAEPLRQGTAYHWCVTLEVLEAATCDLMALNRRREESRRCLAEDLGGCWRPPLGLERDLEGNLGCQHSHEVSFIIPRELHYGAGAALPPVRPPR